MIGLDTPRLHELISRIQDGDGLARDELIRAMLRRMEALAQRMLRGFPGVRRWEDTQDVLQTALMRLMQSLERVRPESTCHFFNLAALHVRRALLDLARHYRNTPFDSLPRSGDSTPGPAAPVEEDDRLDSWTAFHEAVDTLPAVEREVFSLAFYHGWPQGQIAELLNVDVRTVRRHWQSACLRLKALVGELPPL
jgi:RNA polymerase sigma factor (sigma-70 family)